MLKFINRLAWFIIWTLVVWIVGVICGAIAKVLLEEREKESLQNRQRKFGQTGPPRSNIPYERPTERSKTDA